MAGILKAPGVFSITPHKVSVCVLLQVYAGPNQLCIPYPFSTVSQHNRLGLYLLALTKSCDDILEPKLEDLINQLREIWTSEDWLTDHLTSRLSSLSSADDLFNFFTEMRGILAGVENGVVEDDQIILDPNSNLGIFVRRCILAFNLLSFEGVCHLLTNISLYRKEVLSGHVPYEDELVDSGRDIESTTDYENMDLENFVYERVTEEIEAKRRAGKKIPFHLHASRTLVSLVEDFKIPEKTKFKESCKLKEASPYQASMDDLFKDMDGVFLCSNWQIQGYLSQQADAIEK
ncbi:hypothetical protein SAY86_022438 [Trapa natans]|nr:hypothetical protein SAY86_022438 [Trapa natans]